MGTDTSGDIEGFGLLWGEIRAVFDDNMDDTASHTSEEETTSLSKSSPRAPFLLCKLELEHVLLLISPLGRFSALPQPLRRFNYIIRVRPSRS